MDVKAGNKLEAFLKEKVKKILQALGADTISMKNPAETVAMQSVFLQQHI